MQKESKFDYDVPVKSTSLIVVVFLSALFTGISYLSNIEALLNEVRQIAGFIIPMVTSFYSLVFSAVVVITRYQESGQECKSLISKLMSTAATLVFCLIDSLLVYLCDITSSKHVHLGNFLLMEFLFLLTLGNVIDLIWTCLARMKDDAYKPYTTRPETPSID